MGLVSFFFFGFVVESRIQTRLGDGLVTLLALRLPFEALGSRHPLLLFPILPLSINLFINFDNFLRYYFVGSQVTRLKTKYIINKLGNTVLKFLI